MEVKFTINEIVFAPVTTPVANLVEYMFIVEFDAMRFELDLGISSMLPTLIE